ncbi:MAG: MFS transporter, partial [Proteobacteria bacterium]|nr:MFS transporter [Pseudomonadota bacterium]
MRTSSSRVFYGWYVVLVAFAGNFLATGTHFYVFNAFMEPLELTRGFSRAQVNLGLALGGVVGLFAQLAHGSAVMRLGPRKYMTAGALCSAVVFAALGRVSSIHAFYGLYILLFVTNGAFCGIVANTAVNNWFVRKRGRAMGASVVGISLAGVVMPYAALALYRSLGLANAFLVLGLCMGALAPLAWLMVRDRPEGMGLLPDGGPPGPENNGEGESTAVARPDEALWPMARVVRTGAFWRVGIAYAASMAGVVGVMSQMAPRFMDQGLSPRMSMALLGVSAMAGALAKYGWGALCDAFGCRRVVGLLFLMNSLGLAAGLVAIGPAGALVFALVYGVAMGGVLGTLPIMVADL